MLNPRLSTFRRWLIDARLQHFHAALVHVNYEGLSTARRIACGGGKLYISGASRNEWIFRQHDQHNKWAEQDSARFLLRPDPQSESPQSPGGPARPVWHILLLVVVGGILFFTALGRLPLLEPDEGRNAEVAREMLATGDLITPHFNTLIYLDKPAAYFWLIAASFSLAGVNEWAARLPSALMGLGTMLLCWFLARKMFDRQPTVGLRAGLIFATSPFVIVYSRLVIFDMTLAFFVSVAMVSYWLAVTSDFKRPLLEVLFFAALGVAAMVKGPVGFLLPLLSIFLFHIVIGRFGELKRLRWGVGALVFLAVALPWLLAVSSRHPDFPRYAFWEESLKRFAAGTTRREGSIFYYLPVYLGGFFPWSLLLFLAGVFHLKSWRLLRDESHRATAFLVSWVAVIFIFFSISQSKLPGYFLPAIFPLSVLTAGIWREFEGTGQERPRWLRTGFLMLAGLGVIMAAAPQIFRLESVEVAVTEKIAPGVLMLVKASMFYSGLVLVALGVIGRNLGGRWAGRKLGLAALVLLAVTIPLLLLRWRTTLSAYANTSSSRWLAQAIQRSPERNLPVYSFYCFRTSLPFYLRRSVWLVTTDASELTSNYVSTNLARLRREAQLAAGEAGGARVPITVTDFRMLVLDGTLPMLVMVRNRDARKLSQTVPEMEPLWNDWEFSVWKVPPANIQRTGNK